MMGVMPIFSALVVACVPSPVAAFTFSSVAQTFSARREALDDAEEAVGTRPRRHRRGRRGRAELAPPLERGANGSISGELVDVGRQGAKTKRTRVRRRRVKRQPVGSPSKFVPSEAEKLLVANATEQCKLEHTEGEQQANAAVVMLVTRTRDLDRLEESLPRLYHFFLRHMPYPLIIFIPSLELRQYDRESYRHSPSMDMVKRSIEKHGGLPAGYNITVAGFDVKFPEVIANTSKRWKKQMNSCAGSVGTDYKHMNNFFTMAMYEHPALAEYRYYMRLDTDFSFLQDVPVDPFCTMAKTGRKFMFNTRKTIRDPQCIDGMFEWFDDYATNNSIEPQDKSVWSIRGAYTSYVGYVGVGDLEFFRSQPVREVARAFVEDGRVYTHRWSDQTYYVLLLGLFCNHSAVGDTGIGWLEDGFRGHSGIFCHKCRFKGKPLPAPPAEPLAFGPLDH